jgi:hypothetical protein
MQKTLRPHSIRFDSSAPKGAMLVPLGVNAFSYSPKGSLFIVTHLSP